MLNFRSPPELTAKIDLWRANLPEPQPSRSEAIRQLLEKALARFKA
jgi:Arc/MetJ-type ribon-helix-helix transcriptional regulator